MRARGHKLSADRRATRQARNFTSQRLASAEQQARLASSVVEQGFSAVLIATADFPDPTVVYINPAFAKATGCSPEKTIGEKLSALASLSAVRMRLAKGIPEGHAFMEEVAPYQRGDGERWGEWRVGPVRDKKGAVTHWLVIFRDITEHRRLEKEILEISDRERQRIGQDLHDGLCQQLAGIELMSEVLEQRLAPRHKSGAAWARQIATHVRAAISQTRLLARGLSPVTLESEGLISALQELAANAEKLFGIRCKIVCKEPVAVADRAAATHLFRIAQEALSNGVRHGSATRVIIEISFSGPGIRLTIRNNGTTFAPEPNSRGMGLCIMQYRAGVLGGIVQIGPGRGRGTVVTVTAPVGTLLAR